ncbi:MAG: hypothetical protein GC162_11250 [Planctomycetes bacterium]|nr:hypothetical protein [Planctomycetota bacterium]
MFESYINLLLAAWVVVSIALFAKLPGRVAAVVCLIGGWALLPVAQFSDAVRGLEQPENIVTGAAVLSVAWWNKATAIGAGCLLGVAFFDRSRLMQLRPRAIDLAIAAWCLVPLASTLRNGLPMSDGLMQVAYAALVWGTPWLMGRMYLIDRAAVELWVAAIITAGLVYVPICLLEMLTGNVLYRALYGFHAYQNVGADRWFGQRPLGLLEDGNQLGMWMASAALAAVWMWRRGIMRNLIGLPGGVVAGVLTLVTLLCQSVGSILLLFAGVIGLSLIARFRARWILAAVIALPILYLGARATGLASVGGKLEHTWIGAQAKRVLIDAGLKSLGWRLKREEEHLKRVWERPLLGWGRSDWWNRDEAVRPWGMWMLELGTYGIVGLTAWMLIGLVPLGGVIWQCDRPRMRYGANAATIALAAVLAINAVDAFLNSTFLVIFIALAGGLVSAPPLIDPAQTLPENNGGAAAARSM